MSVPLKTASPSSTNKKPLQFVDPRNTILSSSQQYNENAPDADSSGACFCMDQIFPQKRISVPSAVAKPEQGERFPEL